MSGVAKIQAWLGHSTPTQALAYVHVAAERMCANADALPVAA